MPLQPKARGYKYIPYLPVQNYVVDENYDGVCLRQWLLIRCTRLDTVEGQEVEMVGNVEI